MPVCSSPFAARAPPQRQPQSVKSGVRSERQARAAKMEVYSVSPPRRALKLIVEQIDVAAAHGDDQIAGLPMRARR